MALTTGEEIYVKGGPNYEGSLRYVVQADSGDSDLPNLKPQMLVNGRWRDVELEVSAIDATARTAAAAAQGVADAALPAANLNTAITNLTAAQKGGFISGASAVEAFGADSSLRHLGVPVEAYGAKGDMQWALSGVSISSSASPDQCTVTGATFTAADIGKLFEVEGAGAAGAALYTTIAAVISSTVVQLAATASTTVSNGIARWGTDDTAAFVAALAASSVVLLDEKHYALTAELVLSQGQRLIGRGGDLKSTGLGGSKLTSFATSGAVIWIASRLAGLRGLQILAAKRRQLAVVSGARNGDGVYMAPTSGNAPLYRAFLDDLRVGSQPGNGITKIGGEQNLLRDILIDLCEGYGLREDDGTEEGRTTPNRIASFDSKFERVRAYYNGKLGFYLGTSGHTQAPVLHEIESCQFLNNCLRSGTHQAYIIAGSCNIEHLNCEDQGYASAFSLPKGATTPRVTPTKGASLSGGQIRSRGGHFSSVTMAVELNALTNGQIYMPRVFPGAYATPASYGATIASNCGEIDVWCKAAVDSGFTLAAVDDQTRVARIHSDRSRIDGLKVNSRRQYAKIITTAVDYSSFVNLFTVRAGMRLERIIAILTTQFASAGTRAFILSTSTSLNDVFASIPLVNAGTPQALGYPTVTWWGGSSWASGEGTNGVYGVTGQTPYFSTAATIYGRVQNGISGAGALTLALDLTNLEAS